MKQLSCENEYSKSPQFLSSEQKHPVNNATSRRAPVVNARYRGQALLISVLLMIFASVLAATFVTVVALNLSQTARSGSVASARTAALAGKTFVNEQLTNSEKGERWLPEVDAQGTPPVGDAYYYTDFERAQGWDQQGYVKFPDPRTTSASGNNTSVFLTKVTEITSDNVADFGLSSDYIGQLRVDIIGRASDNDAAYSRLVFYKPTSLNGNVTSYARYVSNWNFALNRPRKTDGSETTPIGTTSTSLIGTNLNIDVEGDGTTIESTTTPEQTAKGNWLIQSDLNLLANNQIRLSNSSDVVKVVGSVSAAATAQITDDGGATTTPIASSTTPVGSRTGLQRRVLDGESYNNDPTSSQVIRPITPAKIDAPDSRWLKLTKFSDIGNGSEHGWGSNNGVYIDNSSDKESVGQLLGAGTASQRSSYRPLTDFEIQRFWMRKSFPGVASTATVTELKNITNPGNAAPLDSFNSDTTDIRNNTAHRLAWSRREINDAYVLGTSPTFPMSRRNLRDNSPDGDSLNDELYTPSLEQSAIRGWVSREEFVPRGAIVELKGDTIVITRDDVADTDTTVLNDPYNRLPNPAKTWKDADGNPIPFAYRMEIRDINNPTSTRVVGAEGDIGGVYPAPGTGFNGVIYAEGNVRVRGYTNDKNITIVSMNNIYIEGGINQRGNGNVALLAKRNVVVNPTQVVARVEGVRSRSSLVGNFTAPALVGGESQVPLKYSTTAGIFPLRIGDKFRFSGNDNWRTVTAIPTPSVGPNDTAALVTFSPALAGAEKTTAGNIYFLTVTDAQSSAESALSENASDRADIIARDVKFDGADPVGRYHLALRHGSINKLGAVFSRQFGDPALGTIDITSSNPANKRLSLNLGTTTNYDLRNIPAGGTTSTANTLGALVWNFYNDDGGTTPPGVLGDRDVTVVGGIQTYAESDTIETSWDLYVPTDNRDILARRLADVSINNVQPPAQDFLRLPRGGNGSVPLTVSVGLYNTDSALSFGSAPTSIIGSGFLGTEDEYSETVNQNFYTGGSTNSRIFFGDDVSAPPTRLSATTSNIAAFRRLLTAEGNLLPLYSQSALKLDRETLTLVADTPITITVEATIYAQNGSWFVIPAPYLEQAATGPDLDKHKNRRFNYQFVVKGNIAENFVPSADIDVVPTGVPASYAGELDADNLAGGAQARWIDALSRPTAVDGSGFGSGWQSIIYQPDATPYKPTSTNNMLYLPITPDITLQR